MKYIIKDIIRYIKLNRFKSCWRRANKKNYTEANNRFDMRLVSVGLDTYGSLNIYTYSGKNCNLIIGNYVSVADGVQFILGGNHNYNKLFLYPFKKKYFKTAESEAKGDIIIEDDVWIGKNVIILSGVKIGKGSVIGAGAVVAKDIPEFSVAIGNPIKIIKRRFNENILEKISMIEYDKEMVKKLLKNPKFLDMELNEENIELILRKIKE